MIRTALCGPVYVAKTTAPPPRLLLTTLGGAAEGLLINLQGLLNT